MQGRRRCATARGRRLAGSRALVVGLVAGAMYVIVYTKEQNRWKIDAVLGVWPLHGLCGVWGGIAAGIFGQKVFGGIGGISLTAQLIGTGLGVAIALVGGFAVYGAIRAAVGLRMDPEDEHAGADLSIHHVSATPETESSW